MAVQAGVAVLASMDVVIGSLVLGTSPALATYQAANIFGRIPVFLGAALSARGLPPDDRRPPSPAGGGPRRASSSTPPCASP